MIPEFGSATNDPVIRTRLRVNNSQCQQTSAKLMHGATGASHWLALASDSGRVEQAMGIEYIALEPPSFLNDEVASGEDRCV